MGSGPLEGGVFEPKKAGDGGFFEPKKVADGDDHQDRSERGRYDDECVVCVEERKLLTIDGKQRRKEDKIGLSDGGYDFYVIEIRRRQECLDP